MITHNDERPYKCDKCGCDFKRQTALKVSYIFTVGYETMWDIEISIRTFEDSFAESARQWTIDEKKST